MLDDWKINWEWRDLPPEVWDFIKRKKFFGMIIPKEYGGLGFSPYAHSEVVRKLSSRSLAAAVTVMVPNSLGPGELLMRFGTKEQQQQWLPRLADGREIPCFGLTSPEAGSDAASMIDTGVICKGNFEGREVLGLRLNWHKRYITLGPVATLLGLAFKAYDPDHLVGTAGRTRHHRGADPDPSSGRRDRPSSSAGDAGVSERPELGQGRLHPDGLHHRRTGAPRPGLEDADDGACRRPRHLAAVAVGGGCGLCGAHHRRLCADPRAVQHLRSANSKASRSRWRASPATAYLLDAARRLTCAALNQGHHPAVISGIMKLQATERMRIAIDDAMDIHGGKAVIDGPQNYLGNLYRSVPVGITVEGANILTRNLIVFGQGAIRAHPYLLQEMNALGEQDRAKGLDAFDNAFWKHVGHSVATLFRACGRSWTVGLFAPAPDAGEATGFYRQLSRYSSAFALCADMALLTLGGALKRKEMLSARFGDILSELYLLSAALKRWQDEGRQAADFAALEWCMASGFRTIENRFAEILANLPNRFVAVILKFLIQPFGARVLGPSDRVVHQCAQLVLEPSAARDRLTPDLSHVDDDGGVARLEKAFLLVTGRRGYRQENARRATARLAGGGEEGRHHARPRANSSRRRMKRWRK